MRAILQDFFKSTNAGINLSKNVTKSGFNVTISRDFYIIKNGD